VKEVKLHDLKLEDYVSSYPVERMSQAKTRPPQRMSVKLVSRLVPLHPLVPHRSQDWRPSAHGTIVWVCWTETLLRSG